MASVGELINHLKDSAENNAGHNRLLNYLNLFTDAEDPLTQSTFFEYLNGIQMCLPNDTDFQDEVTKILRLEDDLQDTTLLANIDFEFFHSLIETEFFDFRYTTNQLESVRKFLNKKSERHSKVQVIKQEGNGAISLVLNHDGSLNLTSYRRAIVLRGEIRPIWSGTRLLYDAQMNLSSETVHYLRLTRSRLAILSPRGSGQFEVSMLELPDFTLRESHLVRNLKECEPIFFEVKRLERLFLDRSSDPFYQETCHTIESAIKRLQVIGERQLKASQVTLENAQRILDEVFIHDKLLTFLLKDLETKINECQENSFQKVVSHVSGSPVKQVPIS